MNKYVENKKEYVGNMKEYVKNMKKYVENLKEYEEIRRLIGSSCLWDLEKFQALPLHRLWDSENILYS